MAMPTLAYCEERGRILESARPHRESELSISSKAVKAHMRRGRELRAEAFVGLVARLAGRVASWARAVSEYRSNRKAMQDLRALPDYLLKDLGISRSDIPAVVQGMAAPGRGENNYQIRGRSVTDEPSAEEALKKAA